MAHFRLCIEHCVEYAVMQNLQCSSSPGFLVCVELIESMIYDNWEVNIFKCLLPLCREVKHDPDQKAVLSSAAESTKVFSGLWLLLFSVSSTTATQLCVCI